MSEILATQARASWHRFLDDFEPLRPDLYRYCRYLTRSPWEAEDLVQDTLARAFVTLAQLAVPAIENPRAWLFRVASNLWLNQLRGRREPGAVAEPVGAEPRRETREAAGTLLAQLAPKERAAVVLKDVFELSLDEIADLLSTTPGAIKSALHRGRGKLAEPEDPAPNAVAREVLDELCHAFNARDLDRVTALLLETAVVEYPGLVVEIGRDAARAGTLRGALFGCDHPELLAAAAPGHRLVMAVAPRTEVRAYRGEPILLCWWTDAGVDSVRAVMRADLDGDRIARLRTYLHSPELLVELGRELAVPVVTTGHR